MLQGSRTDTEAYQLLLLRGQILRTGVETKTLTALNYVIEHLHQPATYNDIKKLIEHLENNHLYDNSVQSLQLKTILMSMLDKSNPKETFDLDELLNVNANYLPGAQAARSPLVRRLQIEAKRRSDPGMEELEASTARGRSASAPEIRKP